MAKSKTTGIFVKGHLYITKKEVLIDYGTLSDEEKKKADKGIPIAYKPQIHTLKEIK